MDTGTFVSWIIYLIFIFMTYCYFYLFRHDRTMKHVYISLLPTFICVYQLINHTHYQPVDSNRQLISLVLISLLSFVCYWSILWLLKKNKKI